MAPSPIDDDHPSIAANKRFRWLILIGLVVSAVLEVMDTSILNVALPQMAGSLGTTTTEIAWVSTAYLLANVVVLPMTAWLSQRFGRKNYLVTSIVIFTISRTMCALSPSLGLVIFWRLVQGAAGAALISTAQAVLVDIFPEDQQGVVQPLFGVGLVVAPAIAPLLGGWIVDTYNWPLLFYIHIPIALMSLYLISTLYADASSTHSRKRAGNLDVPGVALLAMGLGSLQYVLEEGQQNDWFNDATIVRFTALAVFGIIALIIWELNPSNRSPIVNIRIYGNRGLSAAVLISFAAGIGMYGVNFAFAVLVQGILRFTSIKSGLALVPMGVGAMLSLMIVAATSGKIDPRIQIASGLAISAAGSWMLGFNTLSTGIGDTWLPLGLIGFGIGGSILPVTITAFAALRPSESADGAAQLGLGRQLGGSFGIALIDTYITRMADFHRASMLEHVYMANPYFASALAGLTGLVAPHAHSMAQAQRIALSIIDQSISLQAVLMGYNNGFQIVAILFVGCIFLIPLLKAPRRQSDSPGLLH